MQRNKAILEPASGAYEYELALMASHVIKEREFVYRTRNFGTRRDYLMAFYSEWWQRILGQESKVAIWAHNGHVADVSYRNVDFMGTVLKESQGDNYRNVGFSMGGGRAVAFIANSDYSFRSGAQEQSIPELSCSTINRIFDEVDANQFYLIFDRMTEDELFYFNVEHSYLQFGAGFNPTFVENYISPKNLVEEFDVMIHFDNTCGSTLR